MTLMLRQRGGAGGTVGAPLFSAPPPMGPGDVERSVNEALELASEHGGSRSAPAFGGAHGSGSPASLGLSGRPSARARALPPAHLPASAPKSRSRGLGVARPAVVKKNSSIREAAYGLLSPLAQEKTKLLNPEPKATSSRPLLQLRAGRIMCICMRITSRTCTKIYMTKKSPPGPSFSISGFLLRHVILLKVCRF